MTDTSNVGVLNFHLHCTALHCAQLCPAERSIFSSRRRARSMIAKKIPTRCCEKNVMRNNPALENIGA
jgi:hypothetical protein